MSRAPKPAGGPRDAEQIRRQIEGYIEQRSDLAVEDFARLSWPILAVWRAVELTYDLDGVGPSGSLGFTLDDFITNLDRQFPELAEEFGDDFARTLMEQYVSMIEYLPGERSRSAETAERLDRAVDDLMRSDLPSVKLH